MHFMPALFAAITPTEESSITMQSFGLILSFLP